MSARGPVSADELRELLSELVPIGLDGAGATTRLAWSEEDRLASAWFAERARELGRDTLRDPAGNLWCPPAAPAPWWGVGSHLDSVSRGGRYDGALGVVAGFAVAAREPVAVLAFADEEGARFNTPTFGSRALAGKLDADDALARADAQGVSLADAMRAAGVDPDGLGEAGSWLARLAGMLELHIDQSRAVARSGSPVAVVSGLASRMRVQAEVEGRADHAGTTLGDERHDALAAAARLIVRAADASEDGDDGEDDEKMVFTATRIEVEPNAQSTVPSRVRLWLDARAADPERLGRWREQVELAGVEISERVRVEVRLRTAAFSPGTEFSREVRAALAQGAAAAVGDARTAPVGDAGTARAEGAAPAAQRRREAHELLCWAGHDAGMVAERIPSGMVLVRNETGISHAPEEDVDLEDAAAGANAILGAVRALLQ